MSASVSWTARFRSRTLEALPPQELLPDRQPAYVQSWIYVFGVLSLAALIAIVGSGTVLVVGGPTWWHTSSLGHFVNSAHLWSVELFFVFLGVHFWGKFFMASWRGRRVLTWITGMVAFLLSVATGLTGYVVQTNFDSQWIASEAKDGMNATGLGAFMNLQNTGQMLLWHVMLMPVSVGLFVVLHIILVRVRGVVPPIGVAPDGSPESTRPEPTAVQA